MSEAVPPQTEEAEGEALLAAYDIWVARGRPGAKSHEEFMAEILGGDDAHGGDGQ